jgi:hypothetical protein
MAGALRDFTPDQAARISGASWLLVILTGIAAEFFIRLPLIVTGDAAATAENITANEGLFRIGIAADVIMLVFDLIATVSLYTLFRPVHRGLVLLATFSRLIMNAVLAASLVHLSLVPVVLGGGDPRSEAVQRTVQYFLDAHGSGYDIALVFFGLHCFILGGIIYRSGYVPKFLGLLLLGASLGYLIDSFAHVLLPAGNPLLAMTASALIGIAVLAELSLSLWLLAKGVAKRQVAA